jgi:hypothetical protein
MLEATLGEIRLDGNLADAERIRIAAIAHGVAIVPFLRRAWVAGSPTVRAATLSALGALDPEGASQTALSALASETEPPQVRAAAAEALGWVPTTHALDALLEAVLDRALVREAALDALARHVEPGATPRIRERLTRLAEELGARGADPSSAGRLRWAAVGLLRLLGARGLAELERDLVAWWRAHPDSTLQVECACHLLGSDPAYADAVLREGLPGANEGEPTTTGELDGPVRQVLPEAVTLVLRSDPADAFRRLAPYLEARQAVGYFGEKRAEIILLLLLGQLGRNVTTWLSLASSQLASLGLRPDPRWIDLLREQRADVAWRTRYGALADEVSRALAASPRRRDDRR